MPWGVAAAVGGALVGGIIQGNAAQDAAQTQADAANQSAQLSMQKYQQTRADLLPYSQWGASAFNLLNQNIGSFIAPFNPTMDQLESTPGYKFTLDQGLKAAQNGYASKGLGVSGAAMKGAADYASGLAQNTLSLNQQIFSANQQNAYNKLMGISSLGENAAAQSGSIGQGYTNAAVNSMIGGANAQAAGTVGQATAWANGINGAGNTASQYAMYNNLMGGGNYIPPINADYGNPTFSLPVIGV